MGIKKTPFSKESFYHMGRSIEHESGKLESLFTQMSIKQEDPESQALKNYFQEAAFRAKIIRKASDEIQNRIVRDRGAESRELCPASRVNHGEKVRGFMAILAECPIGKMLQY